MGKTCLKCSHINPAPSGKAMEACPACGAIYTKVEYVLAQREQARAAQQAAKEAAEAKQAQKAAKAQAAQKAAEVKRANKAAKAELVSSCINSSTNKTDTFVFTARRKPQP